MTSAIAEATIYSLTDVHRFKGGGAEFIYLPGSGGVFALSPICRAVLNARRDRRGAGPHWSASLRY
jgi:hypothetical protein